MENKQKKILLGMLVSNGDCLMATIVAKQIKQDFPGCHLTWAISNLCRHVIEQNPQVDVIWEIQVSSKQAALKEDWYSFKQEALTKKKAGEFDELFFLQIYPDNLHFFDGTTRGTIYKAYPFKVTVDARPVIRLTSDEIKKVKNFADKYQLQKYKYVILFECTSLSGQSFVTPEWAISVSEKLTTAHPDLFIILSTHIKLASSNPRIVVAGDLSFRENAELTKYCNLLIGCSSGITWLATTDWAKRLPMIQFLKRGIGFSFASVAYDHKYWRLDETSIIESTNENVEYAVKMISDVLSKGMPVCKPAYHQILKPRFVSMLKYAFMFIRRGKFKKAFEINWNFLKRNFLETRRKTKS